MAGETNGAGFRWQDWTAPRWWPTWLALGFLWLVTRLPFDVALAIGRGIGHLAGQVLRSRRRVALVNLRIAFPDRSDTEHRRMALESFEHVGMATVEMGWCFFRDVADAGTTLIVDREEPGDAAARATAVENSNARFVIENTEPIDILHAAGEAMIFLQPHFTLIELCAHAAAINWPVNAVYDPPKNPMFAAFLVQQRERVLHRIIDNRHVRDVVRILRNGGILWFSPDQSVSPSHGGVPLRYFGQPALTTTGTARMLKMSGAKLIPFQPIRERHGRRYRYRFRFLPAVNIDTGDINAATQHINDLLEAMVRDQPEQYLWGHKRFKQPGPDYPDPYKPEPRGE
ncbi:MAG: hypothetical protein CSB44_09225 [Gammaproteobacteria bacterium]|nr:MAG: hypothetical protein CSB44_09225 [Gammaproteobacteria bacterium]